jgi:hypothetical protein
MPTEARLLTLKYIRAGLSFGAEFIHIQPLGAVISAMSK